MLSSKPRATVVMPMYNREHSLKETIDSVLSQTFQDFEFIIIDDCSTDRSIEIVQSYRDPRIKLLKNDRNQGTSYSRNLAIDKAQGDYIITVDSDDINLPQRFAKQIAYMDSHPEVGICGSWVRTIGEAEGQLWRCAVKADVVHCMTLFEAVLCHPSTILRREFLDKYSLRYDVAFKRGQDWELYCRAARHGAVVNIPEVLVYYRCRKFPKNLDDNQLKSQTYYYFYEVDKKNFQALNIQPNEDEMLTHRRLGNLELKKDKDFVLAANQWLHKLLLANQKANVYPQNTFHRVLADYWLSVCSHAFGSPVKVVNEFFNSPYLEIKSLNLVDTTRIIGKKFIKQSYFSMKSALSEVKIK